VGFFGPSPHGSGPNPVGWAKLTPLVIHCHNNLSIKHMSHEVINAKSPLILPNMCLYEDIRFRWLFINPSLEICANHLKGTQFF